jgi:hypothetical protein
MTRTRRRDANLLFVCIIGSFCDKSVKIIGILEYQELNPWDAVFIPGYSLIIGADIK